MPCGEYKLILLRSVLSPQWDTVLYTILTTTGRLEDDAMVRSSAREEYCARSQEMTEIVSIAPKLRLPALLISSSSLSLMLRDGGMGAGAVGNGGCITFERPWCCVWPAQRCEQR